MRFPFSPNTYQIAPSFSPSRREETKTVIRDRSMRSTLSPVPIGYRGHGFTQSSGKDLEAPMPIKKGPPPLPGAKKETFTLSWKGELPAPR